MKASLNSTNEEFDTELITRTDEFLKNKGIVVNDEDFDITIDH